MSSSVSRPMSRSNWAASPRLLTVRALAVSVSNRSVAAPQRQWRQWRQNSRLNGRARWPPPSDPVHETVHQRCHDPPVLEAGFVDSERLGRDQPMFQPAHDLRPSVVVLPVRAPGRGKVALLLLSAGYGRSADTGWRGDLCPSEQRIFTRRHPHHLGSPARPGRRPRTRHGALRGTDARAPWRHGGGSAGARGS